MAVRGWVRAGMMGLALLSAPALAVPTGVVPLPVSAARATTLTTWVPKTVRGVVLFSTGHGSWPERYDAIASAWAAAGFAVVAPLHVDSMHYADRAAFSREASFGERIADMKAASAYAARRWPGRPVVAAGHSFGTLTALCLGGGLAKLADFRDPTVKAVLGFSSPGRIPGLIAPDAYATDTLPILLVTGDRDVVPGLVGDWHDHLFPIESAPAGDKYALVLTGADHGLIGTAGDPDFGAARTASLDFLGAYALGNKAALRRLSAAPATDDARWIRR